MATVEIESGRETLKADLYGKLPARRAAILCHGQSGTRSAGATSLRTSSGAAYPRSR